jgi:NADP-dependent 3-hydroxy acid dehydrogenase YdfG
MSRPPVAGPPAEPHLVPPLQPYPTKSVLVFGASGAIGSSTALRFARSGHHLGLIGRNSGALALLADRCLKAGALSTLPVVADLTDAGQTARAVKACVAVCGPFSVVVCAAGTFQGKRGLSFGAPSTGDLLAIERNVVRATAPHLREQRNGAIVLCTSCRFPFARREVASLRCSGRGGSLCLPAHL